MNKDLSMILGVALIGFVSFLDYTIINTALPTIQNIFQVSILDLQWVFNIYTIVMAVSMIILGQLGDMYGRRLIFYAGAITLALASIGAGISDNYNILIIFRALQSIGIAAVVTLIPSLIIHHFHERTHHFMSLYMTIAGIGFVVGPFVGGVIVTHISWRWIFFINVPIIIIALILCLISLKESKSKEKIHIDFAGMSFLTISLVSLIYGLIHGEQTNWLNYYTVLLLLLFVVSTIFLFQIEKYRQRRQPIINFKFFTVPSFLLATLACVMSGCLITPILLFSPLFLQQTMSFTPKTAGLLLLVMPISIVLFSPLIGKLTTQFGEKIMLIITLGIGLLSAIILAVFSHYNSIAVLILALFIAGVAWTMTNIVGASSAGKSVGTENSGVAIGTVLSVWNTSASIMIALTSLLFHSINSHYRVSHPHTAFVKGFQSVSITILIAMLIIFLFGLFIANKYKNKHVSLEAS